MVISSYNEVKHELPTFGNNKAKVTGKEQVYKCSLKEWNRIKNDTDKNKNLVYKLIGIKHFTYYFITN